jgi:hypothetical protein
LQHTVAGALSAAPMRVPMQPRCRCRPAALCAR